MPPRLAFTTLASPAWDIQHIAATAAILGYDAVELRLLDGEVLDPLIDSARIRTAVGVCRDQGVGVCAFDTSCRMNRIDPIERATEVEILARWIDLAAQLDVPILRVFGGENSASPSEQDAAVIEALGRIGPMAERAGVQVALETHDAYSSAFRVARVLAAVSSPAVGALWDSHHPYRMGESVDEVLDVLGDRLIHVHIKDARRRESDWDLVLLGEGEVPVRTMIEALVQRGYAGYLSVEWEKKWHPEIPDPEIALPQHREMLARYLASR